MRKTAVVLCLAALSLSACVSTKSMNIMTEQKISGPKVIAMQGTREPWVYEIEKRVKANGFQIKRIASVGVSAEQVSNKKVTAYNESAARFVMLVNGHAPNDSMRRCMGGGYKFDYINVELVDIEKNETVFHYSNSGYSEDCQPLSGTIFADIAQMTLNSWE